MRLLFPLLALIAMLAVACTSDEKAPTTNTPTPAPAIVVDHTGDPFKIVVSLPIFADMVREIAGSQAQVTTIIPVGADPQTYMPTDDQIKAVSEASIIFYNGLGLETPTQQFLETHQVHPTSLINFSHNIPSPSTQQPVDHQIYAEERGDDPHLYLDPQLAKVYPETIADTMVIKDGQNAAFYNARYTDYRNQIDAMNDFIRARLAMIPDANKSSLITYHNSLIHFARRYGLGVLGTVIDSGADGLTQAIAQKHPPAVFSETGYDDTVLEQVAGAAGIRVCQLDTDAIANETTTYLQMMQKDAETIATCLGAPAPTPS
ncbi:MAG: metal ABC transporter substrate-binding protein [Chloroflexota bacterium]